ncbi:hypothetical protein EV426DRAFT_640565 [Tirmania nivea]|nr:hypothetical protein EV426DRAFT_640565 [Tirmania nivea]
MQRAFLSSFPRPALRSRRCPAPPHRRRRRLHAATADPTAPASQTIFSGIQPTGVPHLGNYLGALRTWVSLQRASPPDASLVFCLVDLHALTLPQLPAQLAQWKRESLATLLAIGLDPQRCTVFEQSRVPAHAELMWLLSCGASMGMLNRMTQWKDKSKSGEDPNEATSVPALKLGLFSYPVLQAADILVHSATHVPVGEDQAQHLELTRNLATSFNHHYGSTFPIPQTILSPAKRIMSLRHPTAKMSKSAADPKSRILLTDPPSTIQAKFASAVTDSFGGITYSPAERPGVSNLIEIYAHMNDRSDFATVAAELQDAGLSMKGLKERVCETVVAGLEPVRREYARVAGESGYLDAVARQGAEEARERAQRALDRAKRAMGLL